MFGFKATLVAVITLAIAACSPLSQQRPIGEPEQLWQARKIQLTQLNQWRIQGRTAVTQNKEAWNAGLYWQQDKENYHIKLLGPFSQGGVSLQGSQHGVILTLADGQQVASDSAETLLLETLSWKLPIEALRDWLRGLPYSQQDYQDLKLDQLGRISYLSQQGWQVKFSRYRSFNGYSMPSKIFISHPDLSVRLLISSWEKL